MTTNNYAKPAGRGASIHTMFPFDDRDTMSTSAALSKAFAAARSTRSDGKPLVAVFRQLRDYRPDVTCVGHSRELLGDDRWLCPNCGQRGIV
jgi:hypothetical protein